MERRGVIVDKGKFASEEEERTAVRTFLHGELHDLVPGNNIVSMHVGLSRDLHFSGTGGIYPRDRRTSDEYFRIESFKDIDGETLGWTLSLIRPTRERPKWALTFVKHVQGGREMLLEWKAEKGRYPNGVRLNFKDDLDFVLTPQTIDLRPRGYQGVQIEDIQFELGVFAVIYRGFPRPKSLDLAIAQLSFLPNSCR